MLSHRKRIPAWIAPLLLMLGVSLACVNSTPPPPTEVMRPSATPPPTLSPSPTPVLQPMFQRKTPTPLVNLARPGTAPLPFEAVVQLWALDENRERLWSGSGTIVSTEGYILTNAHVVLSTADYPVSAIEVLLTVKEDAPPESMYLAQPVIFDRDLDLAVLRLTRTIDDQPLDYNALSLPRALLGNSAQLRLGSSIRILGYPGIGGETITLTSGEVAGFTSQEGVAGRAYIKTSATIAGGNSGGMAIDEAGLLIGVPTQLGYGGEEDIVDCRLLVDTNDDGVVDARDACVPTGGFINALRPIRLAKPLIDRALSGEVMNLPDFDTPPPPAAESLPDPGRDLLRETFEPIAGDWRFNEGTSVREGHLEISLAAKSDYRWAVLQERYNRIDFQAEAERLGGPLDNSFGLIFHFQDDRNFYSFEISSDGFYGLSKIEGGQWVDLIPWTPSALIDTRSDRNQLAVTVDGTSFRFFINGTLVDRFTDTSFNQGQVGVIASSYSQAGVQVSFDNLLLRAPGVPRLEAPQQSNSSNLVTVYQDDFSHVDEGWRIIDTLEAQRRITNGELSLQVLAPQTDAWVAHSLTLDDVVVAVDVRWGGGAEPNNYGVICRHQDARNYYLFQINSAGAYAITRVSNGLSSMLVDWTSDANIRAGNALNRLRVECVGDRLKLFVNDTMLAGVIDNSLQRGQIALAAGTFDEGDTLAYFDNLTVSGFR